MSAFWRLSTAHGPGPLHPGTSPSPGFLNHVDPRGLFRESPGLTAFSPSSNHERDRFGPVIVVRLDPGHESAYPSDS